MWLPLSGLAVALLLVGLWVDWRSRRRVRSVPARQVTPEAVRYVSLRATEDGR